MLEGLLLNWPQHPVATVGIVDVAGRDLCKANKPRIFQPGFSHYPRKTGVSFPLLLQ